MLTKFSRDQKVPFKGGTSKKFNHAVPAHLCKKNMQTHLHTRYSRKGLCSMTTIMPSSISSITICTTVSFLSKDKSRTLRKSLTIPNGKTTVTSLGTKK